MILLLHKKTLLDVKNKLHYEQCMHQHSIVMPPGPDIQTHNYFHFNWLPIIKHPAASSVQPGENESGPNLDGWIKITDSKLKACRLGVFTPHKWNSVTLSVDHTKLSKQYELKLPQTRVLKQREQVSHLLSPLLPLGSNKDLSWMRLCSHAGMLGIVGWGGFGALHDNATQWHHP